MFYPDVMLLSNEQYPLFIGIEKSIIAIIQMVSITGYKM